MHQEFVGRKSKIMIVGAVWRFWDHRAPGTLGFWDLGPLGSWSPWGPGVTGVLGHGAPGFLEFLRSWLLGPWAPWGSGAPEFLL